MKKAIIFGVTGQDGAYLTRLLLSKNYIVHGIKRRSSSFNTSRIDDIYTDPHKKSNFFLHTDKIKIIKKTKLLLTGDKGIKKCKVKETKDINIMPKIIF